MLESPAKRRRLDSPTPEVVRVDNDETTSGHVNAQQPTTPTTPRRRASYLSPTKSYLARSHPQLVSRSTRQTDTRGKALRNEILKRTPAVTASAVAQGSSTVEDEGVAKPGGEPRPEEAEPANENLRERDTNVGTNAEATQTKESEVATIAGQAPRSPLRERQPLHTSPARRTTTRFEFGNLDDPALPAMVPTLVPRSGATSTGRSRSRLNSNEPELPPTPVQLGLSTAPDRPRGLASSSSPRGSKTGGSSGRHRRRLRVGGVPNTSSPLKPKAQAPATNFHVEEEPVASDHDEVQEALESTHNDVEGVLEVSHDNVDEAPQSEAEEVAGAEEEDAGDSQLREQQSTLQSLKDQLQKLREDNAKLEAIVEHDAEIGDDASLAFLRQTISSGEPNSAYGQNVTEFSHDPAGEEKALGYLTLFAPGNLQLTSRTETRMVEDRLKVVHFLTVTAPPPWLPNVFACTFQVTIDPEDVRVEDVQMTTPDEKRRTQRPPKTGVFKWAHDRLHHPLHRLDVAGVIWGVGSWFGAAVERAKVFDRLDRQYNKLLPADEKNGSFLTRQRAVELTRCLNQTQIEVSSDQRQKNGRNRNKVVLMTWHIDLDSTGGAVRSDVDIAVSGSTFKAEAGFKQVFASLLPSQGVVGAFESVWRLMHDNGPLNEDSDKAQEPAKGKRKRGV